MTAPRDTTPRNSVNNERIAELEADLENWKRSERVATGVMVKALGLLREVAAAAGENDTSADPQTICAATVARIASLRAALAKAEAERDENASDAKDWENLAELNGEVADTLAAKLAKAKEALEIANQWHKRLSPAVTRLYAEDAIAGALAALREVEPVVARCGGLAGYIGDAQVTECPGCPDCEVGL